MGGICHNILTFNELACVVLTWTCSNYCYTLLLSCRCSCL